MKKFLSLILAGAMVLSLTACSGSGSSGTSAPAASQAAAPAAQETTKAALNTEVKNAASGAGQTLVTETTPAPSAQVDVSTKKSELVVATTAEPDVFMPFDDRAANTNDDSILLQNVYECAFRLMPDGSLTPWLATGYDWSEDGKDLTVHFRDDVYFSNGDPMTADDVVFSWTNAQAERSVRSLWGNYFVGVEKTGDYDVTVHMSNPYPPVLVAGVSGRSGGVANKKLYEEIGADAYRANPVGTGPYKLTEAVTADHMTFEINENYWGEKKPFYKKITLKFLTDQNTQILALETGDIDVLLNCGLSQVLKLDPNGKHGYETAFTAGCMSLSLNCNETVTKNKDFRKALQYAINREDINTVVYEGLSQVTDIPYPPFFTDVPDEGTYTPVPEYDPEKAKEYLAKSGYNGEEFVLACQAGKKAETGAQIIQGQLINIGINCSVKALDSASNRAMLNSGTGYNANAFDTVQTAMDISLCAGNSTKYARETGTQNVTIPDDPEMDEWVYALIAESDSAKRKELGAKILSRVNEEAYSIPLILEYNVSAWDKSVEGIKSRPYTGLYFFSEWY